jgi:hypothetical protein
MWIHMRSLFCKLFFYFVMISCFRFDFLGWVSLLVKKSILVGWFTLDFCELMIRRLFFLGWPPNMELRMLSSSWMSCSQRLFFYWLLVFWLWKFTFCFSFRMLWCMLNGRKVSGTLRTVDGNSNSDAENCEALSGSFRLKIS